MSPSFSRAANARKSLISGYSTNCKCLAGFTLCRTLVLLQNLKMQSEELTRRRRQITMVEAYLISVQDHQIRISQEGPMVPSVPIERSTHFCSNRRRFEFWHRTLLHRTPYACISSSVGFPVCPALGPVSELNSKCFTHDNTRTKSGKPASQHVTTVSYAYMSDHPFARDPCRGCLDCLKDGLSIAHRVVNKHQEHTSNVGPEVNCAARLLRSRAPCTRMHPSPSPTFLANYPRQELHVCLLYSKAVVRASHDMYLCLLVW